MWEVPCVGQLSLEYFAIVLQSRQELKRRARDRLMLSSDSRIDATQFTFGCAFWVWTYGDPVQLALPTEFLLNSSSWQQHFVSAFAHFVTPLTSD